MLDMIFYLMIGCAGYFSQFNSTSQIVVERLPLNGRQIDYFMLVAALGIALIMVMSVPVNHHPFRGAIFTIILKKEDFS
jgi:hypothetical protein